MQIISDLDRLGPAAFLLDLFFVLFIYRIWRKSRPAKSPASIWE